MKSVRKASQSRDNYKELQRTCVGIPEPGTFSKRFPSTVSTYVATEKDDHAITMGMGLTSTGVVWCLLSTLATCLCCVGFIFPYWITGSMLEHTFHFGIFRRCNYPTLSGDVLIGCGRYASFQDIPTLSWKLCTILIAIGCVVAMLVAFTGILACCVRELVTRRVGCVAGVLQLLAACLVGGGCALYPNGWGHPQVQVACGPSSGPFQLGQCSLSWAYLVTASGAGLLLISSLLSCKAGHRKLQAYQV